LIDQPSLFADRIEHLALGEQKSRTDFADCVAETSADPRRFLHQAPEEWVHDLATFRSLEASAPWLEADKSTRRQEWQQTKRKRLSRSKFRRVWTWYSRTISSFENGDTIVDLTAIPTQQRGPSVRGCERDFPPSREVWYIHWPRGLVYPSV
jgi:hypothetical protein